MSPRQLAVIAAIVAEDARNQLVSRAISARVAQADKKGWTAFMGRIGKK